MDGCIDRRRKAIRMNDGIKNYTLSGNVICIICFFSSVFFIVRELQLQE